MKSNSIKKIHGAIFIISIVSILTLLGFLLMNRETTFFDKSKKLEFSDIHATVYIPKMGYISFPTTTPTTPIPSNFPSTSIPTPSLTNSPTPTQIITPPEINWGNRSKNQIIFTFDAGSGNQSARKILDTLKKYNLKSTFFITGTWASQNESYIKEMSAMGNELFNHTYTHPHLTQVSDTQIISELARTEDLIIKLTNKTTKPFFRAPYGERNNHILQIAAQQGYQSVFWTIDALDWKESLGVTAEQVKERIYANLKPGTIYLMHIGDNITGLILDEVFQKILNDGFQIVSLKEGIR